jgi:signal transduction histidine kinase
MQGSLLVRGQEERLARVVGHVVQNALDATPAEGRVELRMERSGDRARVVVADTGQGMSTEFVNTRLFKPFSTTKAAGMGIGAYESFQYVKELGGQIQVDSEVGRGTTITIELPLHDAKTRPEAELTSTP